MKVNEFHGELTGKGKNFALVVSRFNSFLSESLLKGALDCLERHEADKADVFRVPGSFEIPFMVKKIAESTKKYDAIICLGVIIKGDTPHFDFIAAETTKGIAAVSLDKKIFCSFGVLTTDNIEQAIERAGTKSGNKGFDAALSALEMVNIIDKVK